MAAKQQPWTPTQTRANPKKNDGTRSMGQILAREGEEDTGRRRILSFSSEEPVDRYFGPEILDHAGDAVNLQRLNEIGVLLFNHDPDKVVGKILRAWVENGRGMAEVEFDTDAAAETMFQKPRSATGWTGGRWWRPARPPATAGSPGPVPSPASGRRWRCPLCRSRRTLPSGWAARKGRRPCLLTCGSGKSRSTRTK